MTVSLFVLPRSGARHAFSRGWRQRLVDFVERDEQEDARRSLDSLCAVRASTCVVIPLFAFKCIYISPCLLPVKRLSRRWARAIPCTALTLHTRSHPFTPGADGALQAAHSRQHGERQ